VEEKKLFFNLLKSTNLIFKNTKNLFYGYDVACSWFRLHILLGFLEEFRCRPGIIRA
jgi:hypothetical protein